MRINKFFMGKGISRMLTLCIFALGIGIFIAGCGGGALKMSADTSQGGGSSGGGSTQQALVPTVAITDGSTDVAVNQEVSIGFGKSLDSNEQASAEGAAKLCRRGDLTACINGQGTAAASVQDAATCESVPITIVWNSDHSQLTMVPEHRLSYSVEYESFLQAMTMTDGTPVNATVAAFCTSRNPLSLDLQDGRYSDIVFEMKDGTAGMLSGEQICNPPKNPWQLSDQKMPWSYDPGVPTVTAFQDSSVNLGDGYFGFADSHGRFLMWKGDHSGAPDTIFLPDTDMPLAGAYRTADFNNDGTRDLVLRAVTQMRCNKQGGGYELDVWSDDVCPDGNVAVSDDTEVYLLYMKNFGTSANVLTSSFMHFDISTAHLVSFHNSAVPPFFVTGDINGDGYGDFVASSRPGSSNPALAYKTDYIYVIFGNGSGTLHTTPDVVISMSKYAITGIWVKDFNGDGLDDIIVSYVDPTDSNPGGVAIFLGHPVSASAPFADSLAKADMIISCDEYSHNVCGGPGMAGVADLNGDGKYDVIMTQIVSKYDSAVYVVYGRDPGSLNNIFIASEHDLAYVDDSGRAGFGQEFMANDVGDVNDDGYDELMIYSHAKSVQEEFWDTFVGGVKPSAAFLTSSTACSTMEQPAN